MGFGTKLYHFADCFLFRRIDEHTHALRKPLPRKMYSALWRINFSITEKFRIFFTLLVLLASVYHRYCQAREREKERSEKEEKKNNTKVMHIITEPFIINDLLFSNWLTFSQIEFCFLWVNWHGKWILCKLLMHCKWFELNLCDYYLLINSRNTFFVLLYRELNQSHRKMNSNKFTLFENDRVKYI